MSVHDNSKLRASIFTKTGSVGAGSDQLQLIKFWRSCAPGKGVCGGGGILDLPYYSHRGLCVYVGTAAGAQCLRLSERFFIYLYRSQCSSSVVT